MVAEALEATIFFLVVFLNYKNPLFSGAREGTPVKIPVLKNRYFYGYELWK